MRFLRVTMIWVLLLPYAVIFLGAASNQLVLIANNDKFPVMVNEALAAKVPANGMLDEVHCVMTDKTHLNLLADIFDFHSETDSIGDLLIDFGGWMSAFMPFVWVALVTRKLYC